MSREFFTFLDPLRPCHCPNNATCRHYCHILDNPLPPLVRDIIYGWSLWRARAADLLALLSLLDGCMLYSRQFNFQQPPAAETAQPHNRLRGCRGFQPQLGGHRARLHRGLRWRGLHRRRRPPAEVPLRPNRDLRRSGASTVGGGGNFGGRGGTSKYNFTIKEAFLV